MKIIDKIETKNLSVLGHPSYLNSMTDAIEHGYLCEDGYNLAYCLKRKYGVWNIVQFPAPIMGPVPLAEEKQREFLDKAITTICSERNVDEVMNINTSPSVLPPTGSYYCKFGSYIVDLSLSEEELFANLHSKHRNVVKKAIKDGLEVDCGPKYKDECVNIINETFARQNKIDTSSKTLEDLSKLKGQCEFWVVKSGEEIQGCAVLLWDHNSSYYLYGGSCSHTHGGAMNLLHWNAMLRMKERGVRYYDFVGARISTEPGSKLEGIQRFKSRFGGPMNVGYLWRYDNHPLKMRLYRGLMSIYFRLKGDKFVDAITEERSKGNC